MFPGGYYGSQGDGLLDEVRIWNVARTEAQIAANKDGELTGPQTGLVGYWPMNEGTGMMLHDVSGAGRDVDLTSAGYTSASWTNGRYSVTASTAGYRYAFNGKELDQDIDQDDYDFGTRIYDARLGRWLSTDPLQKKYSNWTPYNYSMNSPLKLRDVDGKDVAVSIVGNTINFSSTIFVTGPGASDFATLSNNAFGDLNKSALQTRTYTDNQGKCYDVKFQINYVAVNPNDPADPHYSEYQEVMSAKVGSNGNNKISLEQAGSKNLAPNSGKLDRTRSNSNHSTNPNYNLKKVSLGMNQYNVEQVRYESNIPRATGNLAYLYEKENGATGVHETFHLFGLGDRYIEDVKYDFIQYGKFHKTEILTTNYEGFDSDLMNQNDLSHFNQIHIDNLVKAALSIQSSTGKSVFVIGQMVDNANKQDKANAVKKIIFSSNTYKQKSTNQ